SVAPSIEAGALPLTQRSRRSYQVFFFTSAVGVGVTVCGLCWSFPETRLLAAFPHEMWFTCARTPPTNPGNFLSPTRRSTSCDDDVVIHAVDPPRAKMDSSLNTTLSKFSSSFIHFSQRMNLFSAWISLTSCTLL
ncbi:hypothetical protein PMAYCL1PPCAC_10692, partial [Pristionchus mayeri]